MSQAITTNEPNAFEQIIAAEPPEYARQLAAVKECFQNYQGAIVMLGEDDDAIMAEFDSRHVQEVR